jgi:uncharacterized protein YndB with AHSA1/START domain
MTVQIIDTPDSELGEVIITREFDAPRELMYSCFFDPEHLAAFWGPVGTHTPVDSILIEPWVGGRFETTMVMDDGSAEYPTKGVFVELNEPEGFTFKEPDSDIATASTFEDLGDGRTRLTIHQTRVPAMFRSDEALAGFMTSLDRFEQHLATLTA